MIELTWLGEQHLVTYQILGHSAEDIPEGGPRIRWCDQSPKEAIERIEAVKRAQEQTNG